ncbi:O-antigen ligase family protein [Lentzea sp. NPDC042327]|uniref:O-antigen ligase family protein n=1 Tax=Lentzea sp. NPDC042327 TaxID=3154801 RepID=UPI0033CD7DDA
MPRTPVHPRTLTRTDGATLSVVYIAVLVLVPSRLVLAGIPLDIRPSMLLGFGLGMCWLCAQMVDNLGMAKGRSGVRTAIFLFASSQIATYGYVTLRHMPYDELKSADLSFVTIVSLMAAGLLIIDGVRTLDRLDRVLKFVVIACTIMAVIGMMQFFTGFDLTKYMAMVPGLRSVGTGEAVLARAAFRRPGGTAGHPIEFGVVCGLAVPLAAHYAFRTKKRRQPSRRWWFCVLMLAMGAVVSLSRSAILGLLVAGIILLPTWPAKQQLHTILAALGFLTVLRAFVPGLVGTLLSLFRNISNDPSIQGRTDDYASTEATIEQNLWLGRGFGTYLPTRYGPIDNQYLGSLVENGLVGMLAFLFLFIAGIYAAAAARRLSTDPHVRDLCQSLLACIAMLGVSSATYDTFAFKIASGLMFVLLGCAGALLRMQKAAAATMASAPVPPLPQTATSPSRAVREGTSP